jgi:hypothetical protein
MAVESQGESVDAILSLSYIHVVVATTVTRDLVGA